MRCSVAIRCCVPYQEMLFSNWIMTVVLPVAILTIRQHAELSVKIIFVPLFLRELDLNACVSSGIDQIDEAIAWWMQNPATR